MRKVILFQILVLSFLTSACRSGLEVHDSALNENNIEQVENLATFGTSYDQCFYSSRLDSTLTTRLINGQTEYLLANKNRENQTIEVWNLEAQKIIQTISETNSNTILFHPDQRKIISFFANETARLSLWNIESGQPPQQFILDTSRLYDDRYVSISRDGLKIALFTVRDYGVDFRITEFNLQTNQITNLDYEFPLYYETPPPYLYTPTGTLMAVTYGFDEKLHLLDLTNQKDLILEFPFPKLIDAVMAEAIISTITVSPYEKYLAGSALNGDVYLWDITNGALLRSFDAHTTQRTDGWVGGVKILEFSPKSNLLVSVGYDRFIRLWDANTGVLLKEINACYHFGRFTQDGRYLVTVGKMGIELWGIP
jgi:WD40 repeat protein